MFVVELVARQSAVTKLQLFVVVLGSADAGRLPMLERTSISRCG